LPRAQTRVKQRSRNKAVDDCSHRRADWLDPSHDFEEADVPRSGKPTLSDVAARAGVAATTASYILNGRTLEMRISSDTEARVTRAARELGYRPNRTAQSLRTASTRIIGVVTDYVAGGMFSARILAGANAAARAQDHVLMIGESDGDEGVATDLVHEFVDRQVDGLLFVTRTTSTISLPKGIEGTRVVTVNCVDRSTPYPSVLPDDHGGGRVAAEAILSTGARDDIVVVGEGPTSEALAAARIAGLEGTLQEAGARIAARLKCAWSLDDAYVALSTWLVAGGRPQVVVCLNDRIAWGVYHALADVQLSVPGDVSVISFDGSDLGRWMRPTLASVALPFFEMGQEAVRILLDPSANESVVMQMPLLAGESLKSSSRV
jgi:LacI family transcriptional regulator